MSLPEGRASARPVLTFTAHSDRVDQDVYSLGETLRLAGGRED